jgi:hypothetical protein
MDTPPKKTRWFHWTCHLLGHKIMFPVIGASGYVAFCVRCGENHYHEAM